MNKLKEMNQRPLFGVLGGMGPLSSAQFLHSIYFSCISQFEVEQDYPRVVMMSDPTIPDRAQAFKNKNTKWVITLLEEKIKSLKQLGADEIMIACITAHLYVNKLKEESKKKLIDIVELLYTELDHCHGKHLILSSKAVYDYQVIHHPNADYPSEEDVKLVQDFIFKIKFAANTVVFNQFIQLVNQLVLKYKLNSVIFACTELHLVNVFIKNQALKLPYRIMDPLEIAANYIIKNNQI